MPCPQCHGEGFHQSDCHYLCQREIDQLEAERDKYKAALEQLRQIQLVRDTLSEED